MAGRLFCTQCGAPQGAPAPARRNGSVKRQGRVLIPWWVWLLVGLLVVLLLPLL